MTAGVSVWVAVMDRARQGRDRAQCECTGQCGKPLPGPNTRPVVVKRDLLADVAAVLERDHAPVKSADIPRRLRELAPTWRPYIELTGAALRERLEDLYGIRVPTTGNKFLLDPSAVREALASRGGGGE